MHLKRLEIHGFKTFAHPVVLEFRPGITAIVGPNGSGKSNVADSVRWVLGEQSYAALRSKRTDDLIFGGGAKRAPSGFAEVALTIDNSDRLLPLPYGEVTIGRRATRAGESEYTINRGRVRLRDVQEAVGPLGGSYTIINQGLVDAALTLRPEERRRLFEDAAEIGMFIGRKSEAESRLRETTANMERSADVLAELEPRLRSLKRQATLARTYRELANELGLLLRRFYRQSWRAARAARTAAEANEQALAAVLARRRAAQAAATTELREARDHLRSVREQLGTLHNQSSAVHTEAETLQRDLAVGAERLAAMARREEEAERAGRGLGLRREELAREQATLQARVAEAEARLVDARAETERHRASLADGETARRAARQRLDAAQREEAAAVAALNENRRRFDQITEQRARLLREQNEQNGRVEAATAAAVAARETLRVAEERFHTTGQARADASATEELARSDLDGLRVERSRADEAVAAARRALADAEARLETLNRLQRSYAGTFAGVRAAMQWAENEGRAFALVSSILRTPPHLETAIEVALGSRIQNVVVERWADAEDAIAALKRSGAGRATFLPLDTVRAGDERRPPSDGQVLGVAADLVDYDNRYAPAIRNLLGRTLVVDDLLAARRVLRTLGGGWTLVTLAGEQVNTGGAVTGGAQIKESGTLRRERELRDLPEQAATHQRDLDARQQARRDLDARYAAAERAVRDGEQARRRATQELDVQREAENRARRDYERAEAATDTQRRRQGQIATELDALEQQGSALDQEQSALQGRVAAAGVLLADLRAQEQARADDERAAQQESATLQAAVAGAEAEARAARTLLQAHEQQIARLDGEIRVAAERVAALVDERAATAAQLARREDAHAVLLAQIDALRTHIGPLEQQLDALETGRATLEGREAEATAALLEAESAHGRASVEFGRASDRRDAIWERAAADDIDIDALAAEEPADQDADTTPEALQERITALRQRIARLGAVNPLALEEYETEAERHTFISTQLDDLRRAADSLRELIGELDGAMNTRFTDTFQAIATEFERYFTKLFGGGEANLALTGPASGSTESISGMGVEITVRPPGKRQQNIALLSGGERALTAAALLFAILKVNPSPFCILDEVDAALDEANVGRFRGVLHELAEQTQFLLVTHNRSTIEAADTIYGVSMGDDGASRVLSLRLDELVEA